MSKHNHFHPDIEKGNPEELCSVTVESHLVLLASLHLNLIRKRNHRLEVKIIIFFILIQVVL